MSFTFVSADLCITLITYNYTYFSPSELSKNSSYLIFRDIAFNLVAEISEDDLKGYTLLETLYVFCYYNYNYNILT